MHGGNLTALPKREGTRSLFIRDTVSSLSIIQARMCSEIFVTNNLSHCLVFGDAIDIKEEEMVTIWFNYVIHGHKVYCVHYQQEQRVFFVWIFVLIRDGN